MDATAVAMPTAAMKKRFGLYPVKIGAQVAHRIGVDMTLEEPLYSTSVHAVGGKSRTKIAASKPHYAFTKNARGENVATKALPGATVYLEVQDLSRLEPELTEKVQWVCTHRECTGKHFDTKEALIQAHPKNKELVDTAERDPYGHAHLYHAMVEIPGVPEKKDEKTGKITPAMLSTILILSDEE